MPVCRHKKRVMLNNVIFRKKHVHYSCNNDYPIGMDALPIVRFDTDYKKSSEQFLNKKVAFGKPNYRLIKRRTDNRHINKF